MQAQWKLSRAWGLANLMVVRHLCTPGELQLFDTDTRMTSR